MKREKSCEVAKASDRVPSVISVVVGLMGYIEDSPLIQQLRWRLSVFGDLSMEDGALRSGGW